MEAGLKVRCITRDLKWGTPVPMEGYTDKVRGAVAGGGHRVQCGRFGGGAHGAHGAHRQAGVGRQQGDELERCQKEQGHRPTPPPHPRTPTPHAHPCPSGAAGSS